jgi:hypothetical protein
MCFRVKHFNRCLLWCSFAIGGVLNFVSFSFGAQSLLSGLAAIQFVTNIFFGALVNGEQVSGSTAFASVRCHAASAVTLRLLPRIVILLGHAAAADGAPTCWHRDCDCRHNSRDLGWTKGGAEL